MRLFYYFLQYPIYGTGFYELRRLVRFSTEALKRITQKIKPNDKFNDKAAALTAWTIDDDVREAINNGEFVCEWPTAPRISAEGDWAWWLRSHRSMLQRSSIKLLNAPDMWCLSVRTFEASTSTDRGYSPHNIHIQSFAGIQFDRTTIIILLSIICAPLIEGIRCELLFMKIENGSALHNFYSNESVFDLGRNLPFFAPRALRHIDNDVARNKDWKSDARERFLHRDGAPPKYWLMMAWQL